MRRLAMFLAAAIVGVSGTALAQVHPQPGTGDPHLQTVGYDPNQVVMLQCALGYQLTVQLSADEQVQTVALGDTSTWQVSANKAGDHLFIKPTQLGAPTNMTVITSVRVYNFELTPVQFPSADVAYTLDFRYPPPPHTDIKPEDLGKGSDQLRRASRYRISGEALVRPTRVSDDRQHTYVQWPSDHPIPATFQIGDNGEERLVNGSVRGDDFVIDGIASKLIFKIDGSVASATRLRPRKAQ